MIRRAEDIARRVEALPGVVSAFASNMVPLGGGGGGNQVIPEGVAITPGQEPYSQYFGTTPHVFKTLNVPLVAGRDLTDAEVASILAYASRYVSYRLDYMKETP